MKTCYICSPYRARTEAELDNHIDYAQYITKIALAAGLAPITPHLYLTQVTDDSKPDERELGLAAGRELLTMCDIVIVGNDYGTSAGMRAEIELADKINKPVVGVDSSITPKELAQLVERVLRNE